MEAYRVAVFESVAMRLLGLIGRALFPEPHEESKRETFVRACSEKAICTQRLLRYLPLRDLEHEVGAVSNGHLEPPGGIHGEVIAW